MGKYDVSPFGSVYVLSERKLPELMSFVIGQCNSIGGELLQVRSELLVPVLQWQSSLRFHRCLKRRAFRFWEGL